MEEVGSLYLNEFEDRIIFEDGLPLFLNSINELDLSLQTGGYDENEKIL